MVILCVSWMLYGCDQRDLIDAEIFEENSKIKTSHTLETKRQDHINTILIVKPSFRCTINTIRSYIICLKNSFLNIYGWLYIYQQQRYRHSHIFNKVFFFFLFKFERNRAWPHLYVYLFNLFVCD